MNKIILITGASTGIGALAAVELAKNNTIIVHYNSSSESAKKIADRVATNGGVPYLLQADLSTESGCVKAAEFVKANFDKLDVLINNAGALDTRHTVSEITWPLMEKIFAINTFSVMRLTSLCVPLLRNANASCVINITSVSIRSGAPTATIYAAAKAAIDSFTRGMAAEVAPNIRVNAIAPGYIRTPFHDGLTSANEFKDIENITPLKMLGAPNHITSAIEFVMNNDFITGETIDVNGGLFMR